MRMEGREITQTCLIMPGTSPFFPLKNVIHQPGNNMSGLSLCITVQ